MLEVGSVINAQKKWCIIRFARTTKRLNNLVSSFFETLLCGEDNYVKNREKSK